MQVAYSATERLSEKGEMPDMVLHARLFPKLEAFKVVGFRVEGLHSITLSIEAAGLV